MARPFKDKQRQTAHEWLVEWASFVTKLEDGRHALGAHIGSYEPRAGTGRPPGSATIEVMRPLHLVRVENAVSTLSLAQQRYIKCNYRIIKPTDREYVKVTPKAREHFLGCLVRRLFHSNA